MSDDRAVKPAITDPSMGRCIQCDRIVPLDTTYPEHTSNGQPGLMMHVHDGKQCGPVAKALVYHVVSIIGATHLRSKAETLYTPEERYDEVLASWTERIGADLKITGDKGAVLVGQAKPKPLILDWKPIGPRL